MNCESPKNCSKLYGLTWKNRNSCKFIDFHTEKEKSPKSCDWYAVDWEITDSLKIIPILIRIPIIVPTLHDTTAFPPELEL